MDPQVFRILEKKRFGESLDVGEIETLANGAASGDWGDAELGAFLMASAIQGLNLPETQDLTRAMLESGDQWRLSEEITNLGDKHSTGGVGDKVSLILSPLMAACGRPIVMLTGRGLGHTGGTADKLEAIPGLNVGVDREQALRSIRETGVAIGMPTTSIAPADGRLYALRDRTGTVSSIPLITASILSKKIATGAAAIVFDVKTGDGAFLPDPEKGAELAKLLVMISEALGARATALLTDMSQPLGIWSGHSAELLETFECLEGRGGKDLMEVTYALCEELATITGDPISRDVLEEAISSGKAREIFVRWAASQGGDADWLAQPKFELAPREVVIEAPQDGFLGQVQTRRLGELLAGAGGGRLTPGGPIDFGVSLRVERKLGDAVQKGDEIARVYLRQEDAAIEKEFRDAFKVSPEANAPALIRGRVQAPEVDELTAESPFWF